jgi:prophage DNA circulation protein
MPTTKITWNNWRDDLQDASFRGVPFKVSTSSAEGGRRTQLHQFPFNDEPYLEDFGREAGTYRVEAYIVQSSANGFRHFQDRDALIAALEYEGPGTLIHPFLGKKSVGVSGKYKLDESFAEGGMAKFTITFVDAGKKQQPAEFALGRNAADAADSAQASVWRTAFAAVVQTAGQVGYVVDSALLQCQYYANAAQAVLLMPVSITSSILSGMVTTIATIRGNLEAVANAPELLAANLEGISQAFASLMPDKDEHDLSLVDAHLAALTFGSSFSPVIQSAPARVVQAKNQAMIIDTVRASFLIEASRAAMLSSYYSYEDAQDMRTRLSNAYLYVMSGIGGGSGDDTLYSTLEDMKQLTLDWMQAAGADLPRLRTITTTGDTVPTLVYAKSLYNDISREAEIMNRNPVVMRHPGFPLGGEDVLVLSE